MNAGLVKIYELEELVKTLDSTIEAQEKLVKTLDLRSLKSFRDNCNQILHRAQSDCFALTVDEAWVDSFARCMRHMLSNDHRSAGVILGVGSELTRHTRSAFVLKRVGCALYYSREQFQPNAEQFLLVCLTDCISRLTRRDVASLVPLFPRVLEWIVGKAAEVKPRISEEELRSKYYYSTVVGTLLKLVGDGGWHTASCEEAGLSENLKYEIWSIDFVMSLFRTLHTPSDSVKCMALLFLAHTAALFKLGNHCIGTTKALGNVKPPAFNLLDQLHKYLSSNEQIEWDALQLSILNIIMSSEVKLRPTAVVTLWLLSIKLSFKLPKADKRLLECVLECLSTSENHLVQLLWRSLVDNHGRRSRTRDAARRRVRRRRALCVRRAVEHSQDLVECFSLGPMHGQRIDCEHCTYDFLALNEFEIEELSPNLRQFSKEKLPSLVA